MVHDVLASLREPRAAARGRPRQEHRPAVVRLSGEHLRPGRVKAATGHPVATLHHGRRMHDHRRHQGKGIELQTEQEHRRLGGDQHLDLLGEGESVGGLPSGVADEMRHEHPHPFEFVRRQRCASARTRDRAGPPTRRRRPARGPTSVGGIVRTSRSSRRSLTAGAPRPAHGRRRRSTRRDGGRRRYRTGSRPPRGGRATTRCRRAVRRARSSSGGA